jgi:dolichol-phosphate mannosyltransferase
VGNENSKPVMSVIVPSYNEGATLRECVERLLALRDDTAFGLEIVIVEDVSTDNSLEIAQQLNEESDEITLVSHDKNYGKGKAVRTGIAHCTGDFITIQDADLEYDPSDLPALLVPLLAGEADVVYGSRFMVGATGHDQQALKYRYANKILTGVNNLLNGMKLSDLLTCYKVFRSDVIKNIELTIDGYAIEAEITAKLSKYRTGNQPVRIIELPISYAPRTKLEGKQIRLKDGVWIFLATIKHSLRL